MLDSISNEIFFCYIK